MKRKIGRMVIMASLFLTAVMFKMAEAMPKGNWVSVQLENISFNNTGQTTSGSFNGTIIDNIDGATANVIFNSQFTHTLGVYTYSYILPKISGENIKVIVDPNNPNRKMYKGVITIDLSAMRTITKPGMYFSQGLNDVSGPIRGNLQIANYDIPGGNTFKFTVKGSPWSPGPDITYTVSLKGVFNIVQPPSSTTQEQ